MGADRTSRERKMAFIYDPKEDARNKALRRLSIAYWTGLIGAGISFSGLVYSELFVWRSFGTITTFQYVCFAAAAVFAATALISYLFEERLKRKK